jgi:hypothetical protein
MIIRYGFNNSVDNIGNNGKKVLVELLRSNLPAAKLGGFL